MFAVEENDHEYLEKVMADGFGVKRKMNGRCDFLCPMESVKHFDGIRCPQF